MSIQNDTKDGQSDYALSARVDKRLNDLIEKARALDNRTRTSFIKQACKKYANEVLSEG